MFDFPKKNSNNKFMSVNYERYRQSSQGEQDVIRLEAQSRVKNDLKLGAQKMIDFTRFFRDVYLLDRTHFFGTDPTQKKELSQIRQLAADPKVRTAFINTLRTQDQIGDSKEVLATLDAGWVFGYTEETSFKILSTKLRERHEYLVREAERIRASEEARKQAEKEAERQKTETQRQQQARANSNTWQPESNVDKSKEWKDAQEKTAGLWEIIKRRELPAVIVSEEDRKAYVTAGFELIKQVILGDPTPNRLSIRAMVEYLMPKMWREPRMVGDYFELMKDERGNNPTAANCSEVSELGKVLIIPRSMQNLTRPLIRAEQKKLRKVHGLLSQSIHSDSQNDSDIARNASKDSGFSKHLHNIQVGINLSWEEIKPLTF